MAECPKCHRPTDNGGPSSSCWSGRISAEWATSECDVAAAAYAKGLAAGVELAKRTARVGTFGVDMIDWNPTNEALRRGGEG